MRNGDCKKDKVEYKSKLIVKEKFCFCLVLLLCYGAVVRSVLVFTVLNVSLDHD